MSAERRRETIEAVARQGGMDLSRFREDGAGRLRGPCPFQKHRSEKQGPFALYPSNDGDLGGWKCFAGCGAGGAKDLAERLGVGPDRVEGQVFDPAASRAGSTAPRKRARPRLTPDQAERAARLSCDHLRRILRLREEGRQLDEEVFAFCNGRRLPGLLESDAWVGGSPLAGLLPPQLPDDLAPILGWAYVEGQRLVVPLYSKDTGAVVGLHTRNVLPDRSPKTRSFGELTSGVMFANSAGLALLKNEARQVDGPVVFTEGVTDFFAVALNTTGPVFGVPGADFAPKAVTNCQGPARWVRGVDLVVATDHDEAGNKAAHAVAEVTLGANGAARVRRPIWPAGADACDVLTAEGPIGLVCSLESAPLMPVGTQLLRALTRTGTELLDADIPMPESLLGNRILTGGGFGLLYGKPGVGKTWEGLGLALALARGETWHGISTRAKGGSVAFISLELPAPLLQERLRTLAGGKRDGLDRIHTLCASDLRSMIDLGEEHWVGALTRYVGELKVDLLIIDALVRAHNKDENSQADMTEVLRSVDHIRLETDAAVLLLHHERKSGERSGDDDMDALRGTSCLASYPTALIRLAKDRGRVRLTFPKVNFGPTPEAVWLQQCEDGSFEMTGAPKEGEELKAENIEKILETLRGAHGLSADEVSEKTGIGVTTVRKRIKELLKNGTAREVKGGRTTRYLATPVEG